ncbi:hypothetical protein [uncultured Parabacteroides sp.]|uniref:hypothetical protein n=1 Tax=uncultured Parabacteroides sp. TaxID=512312 RepID=UPI0026177A28|nr:hypothetical protein [uncultured Parabacteroides sp.]
MVILRRLQNFFRKLEHLCLPALQAKLNLILATNCDLLVAKMLDNPKYVDPKRLETYGFSVYSQNDEDGIIQEIFNRIGISSKIFVEFGVGHGLENNTAYLLMQGWKGLWIEGSSKFVKQIKRIYKKPLENKQLILEHSFITKDNINELIGTHFNGEIDLLSVDIDGNDYYVWKNITCINPRVVIAEYNAKFPPPCRFSIPYNENHIWDGSDLMGMSLQTATDLAESLGYQLVGTNLNGVNAFFVRKDLVNNLFAESSAAILYNAYRPYIGFPKGHVAKYFLG